MEFRRERPLAHASGVGFENADDAVELVRAHAGTGGGVAGYGIGRGDEGIRPVIDVQMDALRALEEHALAFAPCLFKLGGHVRQMRDDARRDGHHFIEHGVNRQGFNAVQRREQDVLFLEGGGDLRFEQAGIGQIRGAHPHAGHLVLIAGADAAAGSPDLLALFELVLAGLVQQLVVRHDEVGL